MTIYIYSTQFEIGQIISDHLTSFGNLCFLFPTTKTLANSLAKLKEFPDLLILDYTTFNHDLFNVTKHLNENSIELPIIFYNDPCITKSTRAKHWESQITLLQNISKIKDFTDYNNVFIQLSQLIENKAVSPYIKLMREPLELPANLKKQVLNLENIKQNLSDNIELFQTNVNLPYNLYYLLKIFQSNKTCPLTLKDIQNIYLEDNKNISESSLKVLISRLRNEIKKDPSCKFQISNERGLYTFTKISKF